MNDLRFFGGNTGCQKLVSCNLKKGEQRTGLLDLNMEKRNEERIILVGESSLLNIHLYPNPALKVVVSAISITAKLHHLFALQHNVSSNQ
jgi:hypothetical protein